jgi:hypothetical protein
MILFHLLGLLAAYVAMTAMGMDFTTFACAMFLLVLFTVRR